ncbi:MAG: tRNA (adenosine(37)-N6)-threonylcarbamoyltransferase complex dimerization subunit type 1 TsaB [Treponema sp.]|jgi:tRNA threonylcarbamoyladenosine biosynthesis protein TsaB|nr:tRNA (adenosine(37)-N6)-threonylcarbamoyltransferase complex dimerization subunit type 1 TsaB [Treponema sp.]
MNILAMDTAAAVLSVGLAANKNTWYFEADAGNRHSEILLPTVDMLLKNAGISLKNVDLVACMKGPGSFTGLRIAFAAAKGISLSSGCKIAAVPTFDCMAYPYTDRRGIIIPVLDAKKRAFFCALFKNGKRVSEDMDAEPRRIEEGIREADADSLSDVLLTGQDAALLLPQLSALSAVLPNRISLAKDLRRGFARELLVLAEAYIDDTALFAGPAYIRKSDAELSLT